jgi:hypothetical protein
MCFVLIARKMNLERCYNFQNIKKIGEKIIDFVQTIAFRQEKRITTLAFNKNNVNTFAENRRKSPIIVVITSTPDPHFMAICLNDQYNHGHVYTLESCPTMLGLTTHTCLRKFNINYNLLNERMKSGWQDWANFFAIGKLLTLGSFWKILVCNGKNFRPLFSTVKVLYSFWRTMGWAQFWAFFHKLIWSPWY